MANLEREYDAVLRSTLGCRAAWLPIVSQVDIGDYGMIYRGVFSKIGNVAADFGVELVDSDGAPARLNFTSENARLVRFAGGAQVPAFTAGLAGEGRLEVRLSAASSFILKSQRVSERKLDNAARVAQALGEKHAARWRFLKYYVVSRVLTGADVVFISTRSTDTTVTFTGSVEALRQVEGIGAHAGVDVAWNKEVGLELVGRSGPIGLGLFRVRWIDHTVVFRGPADPSGADYLETAGLDADLGDTI